MYYYYWVYLLLAQLRTCVSPGPCAAWPSVSPGTCAAAHLCRSPSRSELLDN